MTANGHKLLETHWYDF